MEPGCNIVRIRRSRRNSFSQSSRRRGDRRPPTTMARLRSRLVTTTMSTAALTWTILSFAIAGTSPCTAFGPTAPSRRHRLSERDVGASSSSSSSSSKPMERPSALFHAKPHWRRGVTSPIVTATTATRRRLFFDEDRSDHSDDALTTADDEATESNQNFLSSLATYMMQLAPQLAPQSPPQLQSPSQTKEEQLQTRQRRLAQITLSERLRQRRVAQDKLPYLFLLSLQFLPLLLPRSDRLVSVLYFFGLAVATVYLGGRQEVLAPPEKVSRQNAFAAPLAASAAIGGLYVLLKCGVDPTAVYAVAVTGFGALAVGDVGVPILRNVVPGVEWETEGWPVGERVGEWMEKMDFELEENERGEKVLPLDGVLTLGMGVLCTLAYWAPVAMENKFLVSNVIAWALAMVSLGAISLGSFQTGAILLAGLFCYDIFWVFGSDVMMTVATKVEAPVKFIYPAPPSDAPRAYPFSVLGLGDVVIPGLFVRFASKIDEALQPQNLSYFSVATAAYAVGLLTCFGVNELTHAGQPALLYLDPSLVGSALACAVANDQLVEVWNFREEDEEANKEG